MHSIVDTRISKEAVLECAKRLAEKYPYSNRGNHRDASEKENFEQQRRGMTFFIIDSAVVEASIPKILRPQIQQTLAVAYNNAILSGDYANVKANLEPIAKKLHQLSNKINSDNWYNILKAIVRLKDRFERDPLFPHRMKDPVYHTIVWSCMTAEAFAFAMKSKTKT